MSPEEPTSMPAPSGVAANAAALAAYAALERELDRTFPSASEARRTLSQPLTAVREAMALAADDATAAPMVAAALDGLEDVLEALLRATGWPATADRAGAGA